MNDICRRDCYNGHREANIFYEAKGKGYDSPAVGDMQKIDLGIALCHFALGAEEAGLSTEFAIRDPGIRAPEKTEYVASFRWTGR